MTPEDFDLLATEIRVRRGRGGVWIKRLTLERSTTERADARADAFVTSLGLTPMPSWCRISRDNAKAGAVSILHRDLAYDSEVMAAPDASRLAAGFLECFPERNDGGLAYFTNGTLIDRRLNGGGWHPITTATFDCGIIVVAKDSIGILWVSDED
ncbi:unnamed protein product [Scytosiphon promiscuus]